MSSGDVFTHNSAFKNKDEYLDFLKRHISLADVQIKRLKIELENFENIKKSFTEQVCKIIG